MNLEQVLRQEIEESQKWMNRQNDDTIYRRDLRKRIELINWVLDNMKNPNIYICALIESKMNEIISLLHMINSHMLLHCAKLSL
jgi:hypothetical protein